MDFGVRLYFSGSVNSSIEEYLISKGVFRLFTFAYPKELHHYIKLADKAGKRARIMIDSGAFTSWSVGRPVQLHHLMEYNDNVIRDYGDRHEFVFISLDKIPGERTRRPTADDINKAVAESYSNFKTMQSHYRYHKVLPVYHSGEDEGLRNAYLQLTDYVCLSMDQNMPEKHRVAWARRSVVDGYFFHGLAATGNKMVTQVPWYSADSSTWVSVAAMGNILWPLAGKRGFRSLAMSATSPSRHAAGYHINTLTPVDRAGAVQYITRAGYTVEQLVTDYEARWKWNIDHWCNPPWKTNVVNGEDLFA
jgi:hypothetical protein